MGPFLRLASVSSNMVVDARPLRPLTFKIPRGLSDPAYALRLKRLPAQCQVELMGRPARHARHDPRVGWEQKSATRIPAAMATAATCVISSSSTASRSLGPEKSWRYPEGVPKRPGRGALQSTRRDGIVPPCESLSPPRAEFA
jgi:hypothetical protein